MKTTFNTTRIMAMILAIVMCLGLAVPAFAASTETPTRIIDMTRRQLRALPVDPAYQQIFDAMTALETKYPYGTPWKTLYDDNGRFVKEPNGVDHNYTASFARTVTNAAFGADAPIRYIYNGSFTYDDIRIGDEVCINDHPEKGRAGEIICVVLNVHETGLVVALADGEVSWFYGVPREWIDSARYIVKRYNEQPAQPQQPEQPTQPQQPETPVETPTEPTQPAVSFTDVNPTDWYADAVNWAVQKGITNGTGNNTFSPNKTCTNVEILTFLYRAAGSPAVNNVNLPFAVQNGWATDALKWAYSKNIINGSFDENAPCTRYTAVDYIWKAFGSPYVQGTMNFSDIAGLDARPIDWAVSKSIVNGTSKTTFSPNDTCTRGTIATLLHRAYAK